MNHEQSNYIRSEGDEDLLRSFKVIERKTKFKKTDYGKMTSERSQQDLGGYSNTFDSKKVGLQSSTLLRTHAK